MDFEKKNIGSQETQNVGNNIDIREIVEKYIKYWKWFLLSIILSIAIAFFNLNFERKIYETTTIIKIKNENTGDKSAMSAFKDLGILSSTNQNVEDEMETLLSKDLIAEVVESMKLNVRFFTNKNYISEFIDDTFSQDTDFYEDERYNNPPLEVNFFISDSLLYETNSSFLILVHSSNNFTFIDKKNGINKKYAFGEKVTADFGDIVITPSIDLKKNNLIGKNILVSIISIKDLANFYAEKLKIEPRSELSSILVLKINTSVQEKAQKFLTELVNLYNYRSVKLKEEVTQSTSDFVANRLKVISDDLANIDLSAESLKKRYRLTDAASTTGLNIQTGQDLENQIVRANTELAKISYIKDFVSSKEGNELIPANVGVTDNNLTSATSQYNQLMMQKKRMLESSTEKNPIVVNLNEQLAGLKNNINQGLANLESSHQISLDALQKQGSIINSRIYSAPRQERQYRDIQRQQQIKEQLYLYLLKKREETAITLGVAEPNATVIDSASTSPYAVAPKKLFIYIGFLIGGLLIPFLIFYVAEMFDKKINSKEEVERALGNVPIIGDVPKIESKGNYLIKKDDYSSAAEAIRILRTNLNFVLPRSTDGNKSGKVIFVTSTIAHEGKSLVATNLAAALAHADKRTLILGLDIRAPSIKPYLGIRGKVGVTNYIVNTDLTPKDLVVPVPNIENLDLISSGDLAPNPAELLMTERIKDLFEYAKENYDYVIVDTAAYSMVTDTLLISKYAEAFLYVIRVNFLDSRALKYIQSLYRENKLPNMSVLVNGIDYKHSNAYGYGYGYGANFEKSHKKKSWWKFS